MAKVKEPRRKQPDERAEQARDLLRQFELQLRMIRHRDRRRRGKVPPTISPHVLDFVLRALFQFRCGTSLDQAFGLRRRRGRQPSEGNFFGKALEAYEKRYDAEGNEVPWPKVAVAIGWEAHEADEVRLMVERYDQAILRAYKSEV